MKSSETAKLIFVPHPTIVQAAGVPVDKTIASPIAKANAVKLMVVLMLVHLMATVLVIVTDSVTPAIARVGTHVLMMATAFPIVGVNVTVRNLAAGMLAQRMAIASATANLNAKIRT